MMCKNPINQKYFVVGILHKLPEELLDCLVTAVVENAKIARKYFDDALFRQRKSLRLKEELGLSMKWTASKHSFVVGIYLHQQYHPPQCWNTPGKAFKEYEILGSESQKLKIVREQIKIRYLGLGFKKHITHDKIMVLLIHQISC